MTKPMPRVAVVQMNSRASVSANLEAAAYLIADAARGKNTLVVLPEMFPMVSLSPQDKVHVAENFSDGPIQHFLSAQAKKYQLWIVAGTIPIRCDNPHKIRAASLVFNHEGDVVYRYDKMHLFDVVISDRESYQESDTVEPGEHCGVIESPAGKLGIAVCYDLRFPELFRAMREKGAELFAIPSAFTVPTGQAHWEVLLRSRAIENFCYVMAAAQTGTHDNNRQTYGHSMMIDPWGTVLSSIDHDVGVISADIDQDFLEKTRRNIPTHQHQRIFLSSLPPSR